MRPYYSKKVIKHFLHPKNFGEIRNPDGIGDTENLRCGDVMKIYIKVKKGKGKEIIKEVKFETMGCAPAIASSDMICQMVKGKTLDEALKIGYKDIADKLGRLPPLKIHCAKLAQTAIRAAIENYKNKKDKNDQKRKT